MFGIGGGELIVIFLIILLLFGARRLPEIAKALGKSVNEFKKAKEDFINSTEENAKKDEPKTTQPDSKDEKNPDNKPQV